MRAVLDLGEVQSTLSLDHPLIHLLANLVRIGGTEFDLRIALDGSAGANMVEVQPILDDVLPQMAISGYVLPRAQGTQTSACAGIHREMRRQHLAMLMPDVVLILKGSGLAVRSSPCREPYQIEEVYDNAEAVFAAMKKTAFGPPEMPAYESALPVLAGAIAQGAFTDPADLVDALIISARVGQEVGPPRLIVDVTSTHNHDHGTGIQRVVRRIDEELRARPVGRRHAETMAVSFLDCTPRLVEKIGGIDGPPIIHRTGDTLLMLDALWQNYPKIADTLANVRRHGGRVITAIYDIVPLQHPNVTTAALPKIFSHWFNHAVAQSDGLICISRAVADEVATYIVDHKLPHRDGLRIGWWHLGSDVPSTATGAPAEAVAKFLANHAPTFLMVGTVEPRKRHEVALAALEILWTRGCDARLLILGREGWNVSSLARRLQTHSEADRRLLWRSEASDDDVTYAYGKATALLFPSLTEGYGLPISEAARMGLGAIASDIPVLREVAGDGALYVPVDDPEALADAMEKVIAGTRLDPSTTRVLSWKESADQLLEVLDDDRWHTILRNGKARDSDTRSLKE